MQQRKERPHPAEMNWALRIKPRVPDQSTWLVRGVEKTEPEWGEFLPAASIAATA